MRVFGFEVMSCNGHDIKEIVSVAEEFINIGMGQSGKPQVLIANTVKGYGLVCMENVPKFHFRIPTEDELAMGKRYERCE